MDQKTKTGPTAANLIRLAKKMCCPKQEHGSKSGGADTSRQVDVEGC